MGISLSETEAVNVLFVCSRNRWRSPTGERVFRSDVGVATRSAGTSRQARRRLSLNDIRWADVILVMEHKHAARIKAEFRQDIRHKAMHVLDIPDEYRFMDEDLVELLRETAGPIISELSGN